MLNVKLGRFWRKAEPVKTIMTVKKNELAVKTKDGATLSWAIDDWKGTERLEPWKHFYKWYFGRASDVFVMRYSNGETMFKRDDIVRFTVHVHTKMVDVPN